MRVTRSTVIPVSEPSTASSTAPLVGASSARTAFWILVNFTSSISIVVLNKKLTQPPHNFKYVLTLTALHFVVTYIGLLGCWVAGTVQVRGPFPWQRGLGHIRGTH